MLAVLGYVVPEVFRFPAAINVEGTPFSEIPNGISKCTKWKIRRYVIYLPGTLCPICVSRSGSAGRRAGTGLGTDLLLHRLVGAKGKLMTLNRPGNVSGSC
jgi:hypothetical protein